jgi:DNA gyrase subunit B
MENQNYDDSSISSLKGAQRVRLRPEAILGSSSIIGARHTVTEILGNALDEASSGYGNRIEVKRYEDKAVSIRDYGRGVPMGYNQEEKRWNWDLVFNELYAGGKYDDGQAFLKGISDWTGITWDYLISNLNYLFSIGLNGLGASATQYSSRYFIVRSYKNGVCREMNFERGVPKWKDLKEYDTEEKDGTFIKWLPDDEVFSDTDVGAEWLKDMCGDTLQVAGVDFVFDDELSGEHIEIAGNGLQGIFDRKLSSVMIDDTPEKRYNVSNFTHGSVNVKGKTCIYVCKAEVLFGFSSKQTSPCCYHNNIKMSGGTQFDAVQVAVSDFFKTQGNAAGIKIEPDDYRGIVACAVSTYSNLSDLRGQTKDSVHNGFIYELVYNLINTKLREEYGKGNEDVIQAVKKVIENAEVRVQTRELAKLAREQKKAERKPKPDKFVSCKAYDKKEYDRAELWISEGDSATTALKEARNSDMQALYPIRGKVLNVLKADISRIVKNKVIQEIFNIIETGMELGGEQNNFDLNNLKFDKIIFATDADEDGYQIRVLLFLIFYRLAPDLLRTGHIYIAETPLFELKLTDGSVLYADTNAEKERLMQEYKGRVKSTKRFKGLGEVDADVLRRTTIHPDTRRLTPLTLDVNDNASRQVIDTLFGADKDNQRKKILTTLLGEHVVSMMEDNALMFDELEETDIEDGIEYTVVE